MWGRMIKDIAIVVFLDILRRCLICVTLFEPSIFSSRRLCIVIPYLSTSILISYWGVDPDAPSKSEPSVWRKSSYIVTVNFILTAVASQWCTFRQKSFARNFMIPAKLMSIKASNSLCKIMLWKALCYGLAASRINRLADDVITDDNVSMKTANEIH